MPNSKPGEIITQLKSFVFEEDTILIDRYKILLNSLPKIYNLTISKNQLNNCTFFLPKISAIAFNFFSENEMLTLSAI